MAGEWPKFEEQTFCYEAYAIFNHRTCSSKLQKKNKTFMRLEKEKIIFIYGEDEKCQYEVVTKLSRANKT